MYMRATRGKAVGACAPVVNRPRSSAPDTERCCAKHAGNKEKTENALTGDGARRARLQRGNEKSWRCGPSRWGPFSVVLLLLPSHLAVGQLCLKLAFLLVGHCGRGSTGMVS